jgi:hypothetical protein
MLKADSFIQQDSTGFLSGMPFLPADDVLFYFFGTQGGAGEGERRDHGMIFLTQQAFQDMDSEYVFIVVFFVFTVVF